MKKKNVYINVLPAIIWFGLFVCGFVSKKLEADGIGNFLGLTYIYLLFLVPIFYGVYNFFLADELKGMFKLYAISLMSQLIGVVLNGTLHYYFISSDSESLAVIQAFLLVTLICTVIIDLIAIFIKMHTNKRRQ